MVDVKSRQSTVASRKSTVGAVLLAVFCSAALYAQSRGGIASFPAQQRDPDDPAVVARGRAAYDLECRSCHGADLRGGERGGPNLLRSAVMLNDRKGELLAPVIQGSHKDRLTAAGLPLDDVTAVSAYIHSVLARAPGQGAPPPGPAVELKVLVGDAAAGAKVFAAKCGGCHSVEGDLKGIGARDLGAAQLQNLWVAGGRGRAPSPGPAPRPMTTRRETTVQVILPTGEKYEGRLEHIDEFVVSLTQADGTWRSFRRAGGAPTVQVRDPLEAHRKLLPAYSDKEIHDVTAYLASIK